MPDTSTVRDNDGVSVTKLRNVRIDDELWKAAQDVAKKRHETVAAVLRRALVEYVERYGE